MKFKKITGGKKNTKEEVYKKFPWLESAKIIDAIVDISGNCLIWKDGVWEGGVWEDGFWKGGFWKGGFWEYGVWEGGVWEDGFWKDGVWKGGFWKGGFWEYGVWKGGKMWSNIKQIYISIKEFKNGKFIK